MDTNELSHDDEMLRRLMEDHLRAAGHLMPHTPAQDEAFDRLGRSSDNEPLPDLLADPLAMLDRGMIGRPTAGDRQSVPDVGTCDEDMRMAARNGKSLSDDVLRKMNDDRNNPPAGQ